MCESVWKCAHVYVHVCTLLSEYDKSISYHNDKTSQRACTNECMLIHTHTHTHTQTHSHTHTHTYGYAVYAHTPIEHLRVICITYHAKSKI